MKGVYILKKLMQKWLPADGGTMTDRQSKTSIQQNHWLSNPPERELSNRAKRREFVKYLPLRKKFSSDILSKTFSNTLTKDYFQLCQ